MDLIQEINDIYDSRVPIEQSCIDIMIDTLRLIDTDKLLLGENHSFMQNDYILTISLQHKLDIERMVLFLFQVDFIELHFESYIKVYQYSDLATNKEIREEFLNLILTILDSSFKYKEYYLNTNLIKYTSIWDNDFLPEKTIYLKPFERIKEKFTGKRQYLIKELRAKSFLTDEDKKQHTANII